MKKIIAGVLLLLLSAAGGDAQILVPGIAVQLPNGGGGACTAGTADFSNGCNAFLILGRFV